MKFVYATLHTFNSQLSHQQRWVWKAYIQRHRLLGPRLLDLIVHHSVVDSKSTEDHKCLRPGEDRGNDSGGLLQQLLVIENGRSVWRPSPQTVSDPHRWTSFCPGGSEFARPLQKPTRPLLTPISDRFQATYRLSDGFDSRWEHITPTWCEIPRPDLPVKTGGQDKWSNYCLGEHEWAVLCICLRSLCPHLGVEARVLTDVTDVNRKPRGSHQLRNAVID